MVLPVRQIVQIYAMIELVIKFLVHALISVQRGNILKMARLANSAQGGVKHAQTLSVVQLVKSTFTGEKPVSMIVLVVMAAVIEIMVVFLAVTTFTITGMTRVRKVIYVHVVPSTVWNVATRLYAVHAILYIGVVTVSTIVADVATVVMYPKVVQQDASLAIINI